jgi:hypothetical protein
MCDDPGSDGYGTLYYHPANRRPLSQTGLLEESPRGANLHGHDVKVAPAHTPYRKGSSLSWK